MRHRTLSVLISVLVWTTACDSKREKERFTPQDEESVVTPELAEDFEPVGCATAACEAACKEFPEEQRIACAEAFRNRCFSSEPPADFDCGEFGSVVEGADERIGGAVEEPEIERKRRGQKNRQRVREPAPTADPVPKAKGKEATTDDTKEKEDLLMDY